MECHFGSEALESKGAFSLLSLSFLACWLDAEDPISETPAETVEPWGL